MDAKAHASHTVRVNSIVYPRLFLPLGLALGALSLLPEQAVDPGAEALTFRRGTAFRPFHEFGVQREALDGFALGLAAIGFRQFGFTFGWHARIKRTRAGKSKKNLLNGQIFLRTPSPAP